MLDHVRAARPYDGKLLQRWYNDEDFDLTVWFTPEGAYHGFQLCYDKRGADHETALTWRPGSGMSLARVDEARSGTPLLVLGGRRPDAALLAKFRRHAKPLDAATKRFVIERLRNLIKPEARRA